MEIVALCRTHSRIALVGIAYLATVLAAVNLLDMRSAAAQSVLPDPSTRTTLSGAVYASILLPDGRLVLGGDFGYVSDVPRDGLARLLADGNLDLDWNPRYEGTVYALGLTQSNALLVGGGLESYPNQRTYHLHKFGPAGDQDPEWSTPAFDRPVDRIAVDPVSGYAFVAGNFTSIGGVAHQRLAKIAPDGSLVESWRPEPNGRINAVVLAHGKLYVGGAFTEIAGSTIHYLASLDPDTGQLTGPELPDLDASVTSIAEVDGMLFVGGDFEWVNTTLLPRLFRLDADSAEVEFEWAPQPDGAVTIIAPEEPGRLLVAGEFDSIGGILQPRLARISTIGSGAADPDWRPQLIDGSDEILVSPRTVTHGYLGATAIGGWFQAVNGEERIGFAKVDGNGHPTEFVADAEIPGDVLTALRQPDGSRILAGRFFKVDGVRRSMLVRLLPSGAVDPDWSPALEGYYVNQMLADNAGMIYVAGWFHSSSGEPIYDLARISGAGNGEVDISWAPQFVSFVTAMALGANDSLFVSGYFVVSGSDPRDFIAKFSTQAPGSLDLDWDPAPSGYVSSLAVGNDGWLYLGGEFSAAGGVTAPYLARVQTEAVGNGDPNWPISAPDGPVRALALDQGQALYVGGHFQHVEDVAQPHLARLDETGAIDPEWQPKVNLPTYRIALDTQAIPYFLAAEPWSTAGEVLRVIQQPYAIVDSAWRVDADRPVHSIQLDLDDTLLLTGSFRAVQGEARGGVARVSLVPEGIFANGFEPQRQPEFF